MTGMAPIHSADSETKSFWDAAADGRLLLKRCCETRRFFHYPRERSPFTGGETEWAEASGLGEIYSCSLVLRAQSPYCIAYIRLDEGPIILSNVVADDLAKLAIGQRVRVVFRDGAEDRRMPFFAPVL